AHGHLCSSVFICGSIFRKRRMALLFGALLAFAATSARAQCPEGQRCVCDGDCNGDGEVGIVELQGCVNGFLGDLSCASCDADFNGEVGIVDLQGAVNSFLDSTTCPLSKLARFDIGTQPGTRGTQVSIPIGLDSRVADVVTIAPVRLNFNAAALSFVDCTSAVVDKTAVTGSPSSGVASVVLYADPFAVPPQALTPIPMG